MMSLMILLAAMVSMASTQNVTQNMTTEINNKTEKKMELQAHLQNMRDKSLESRPSLPPSNVSQFPSFLGEIVYEPW